MNTSEETNVPLQGCGTVSDILKSTGPALERWLREQGFVVQTMRQVHDSLVLEVRKSVTVGEGRSNVKKVYKGMRKGTTTAHETRVMVHPEVGDNYLLPWRLDLRNYSPTGLNWGYSGSGSAQCALAILADHLRDDQKAIKLHQRFKSVVIAELPIDQPWELTSEQVDHVLARLDASSRHVLAKLYAMATSAVPGLDQAIPWDDFTEEDCGQRRCPYYGVVDSLACLECPDPRIRASQTEQEEQLMAQLTVTIYYEKHKPALHSDPEASDPEAEAIIVDHVFVNEERVLFHHKHGADSWIILDANNNRLRLILEPQPCPTCGESRR